MIHLYKNYHWGRMFYYASRDAYNKKKKVRDSFLIWDPKKSYWTIHHQGEIVDKPEVWAWTARDTISTYTTYFMNEVSRLEVLVATGFTPEKLDLILEVG